MRIAAEDATPAERAAETEALLRLMRGLPGLDARRAEEAPPAPGERGGAVELGTILLALVTSGAVTALVNVLQARLGRARKASVTFEAADGRKMSVTAENLGAAEIAETTARLRAIFEPAG